MWFLMLMRYDVPCWTDMSIWDGAVLPSQCARFVAMKSHGKWSWKLFSLHITIVDYIHWTLSSIFILHTSVVQFIKLSNLVNTVYHLKYQPKCIYIFLISNVYMRKLHMIIFGTAELSSPWASGEDQRAFVRWEGPFFSSRLSPGGDFGGSLVVDIGCLVEQLVDYLLCFWFRMVQVGEAEHHRDQVDVYLVVTRCGGNYFDELKKTRLNRWTTKYLLWN